MCTRIVFFFSRFHLMFMREKTDKGTRMRFTGL